MVEMLKPKIIENNNNKFLQNRKNENNTDNDDDSLVLQSWSCVWKGSQNSCVVNSDFCKRGQVVSFRICSFNAKNEKSQYSDVLHVKIRNTFRSSEAWKKKKNKAHVPTKIETAANTSINRISDFHEVESEVKISELKSEVKSKEQSRTRAQRAEESWVEVYDQVSGGWYWKSNSGRIHKVLPNDVHVVDEYAYM